jgi:oligopeptide/dipeptide ABC transporter ATP-binding protein
MSGRAEAPLLEVRDLRVVLMASQGEVCAVDGVSMTVEENELVGIVGESGAGKSVTALAIMGLLPRTGVRVTGQIRFRGRELLGLSHGELRGIRGTRIAMVFQDPSTCLSPRMTAGDQIVESIRAHREVSRKQARRQAIELLRQVGIAAPTQRVDEFPHRLSGGMAQRVMIAMAIAGRPDLLIADEPTTSLDVSIEAQVVALLRELRDDLGAAVVLITHDLALQARFAERLLVAYAGRIVESGSTDTIFYRPTHPYTWGLMSSLTRIDRQAGDRFTPIPGDPPTGYDLPPGCAFHPRCRYAEERCRTSEPELAVRDADDHPSACHFAGHLPRPEHLLRPRP